MKKKLIIIIIIAIVVISLISGVTVIFLKNKNKPKDEKNTFDIKERIIVNNCHEEECPFNQIYNYYNFKLDYDNVQIQNILHEMNEETLEKYNETINSNMNDASCESVKDKYKYRKVSYLDYRLFENSEFITVKYNWLETDLCTKESKTTIPKVYVFSKKKNKIITQKEFRTMIKATDELINISIVNNLALVNRAENTNYTYENAIQNNQIIAYLYYSYTGELYLTYYQKDAGKFIEAEIKLEEK